MNRVLAIVHPDCGDVVSIAVDGTGKTPREVARRQLAVMHAAGYTRLRIQTRDGIQAKQAILAAGGGCDTCRITAADGAHPAVQRIAAAQAALSGAPTEGS